MALMALVWTMSWLSACHHDDPNPQDQLKKSWQIGSTGFIKQDGVDVSADYPGIVVTWKGDGTYTTTNAKKLFYPEGTWVWQGNGTTLLAVDGSLPVTVNELTSSKLHITFTMDRDHVNANGRTQAVVGNYELLLQPQ